MAAKRNSYDRPGDIIEEGLTDPNIINTPFDIRSRAEMRFQKLRANALNDYVFDPTSINPPTGFCLSTIARIAVNDASLLDGLKALQQRLEPVGELYCYPQESLHISLLGCTSREELAAVTEPERIAAVQRAVRQVVAGHHSITLDLGRVNLIGSQFFVEVYADDEVWSQMRAQLTKVLVAIGETPISFPDTEPMHLNLARLLSSPDQTALKQLLSKADFGLAASLIIQTVELVVTDFVVSPEATRVVEVLQLDDHPA